MSEFAAPMPVLARYAVMVDVGYIYAAAGELLFGTSARRDYRVDAVGLIQVVTKHADEPIRGELLRVYWYDAARDRVPTIDQRVIAQMPWVKLRLGNLNARGQQKGVDAQIRADMEALARHRAITDSVLIAGDEDMVPAVGGAGSPWGASSRRAGPTRPSAWSGNRTRSTCWTARSCGPTSPRTPPRSIRGPTRPWLPWETRRRHPPRPSCAASTAPGPSRVRAGSRPSGTPAASRPSGTPGRCPASGPTGPGSRRP